MSTPRPTEQLEKVFSRQFPDHHEILNIRMNSVHKIQEGQLQINITIETNHEKNFEVLYTEPHLAYQEPNSLEQDKLDELLYKANLKAKRFITNLLEELQEADNVLASRIKKYKEKNYEPLTSHQIRKIKEAHADE